MNDHQLTCILLKQPAEKFQPASGYRDFAFYIAFVVHLLAAGAIFGFGWFTFASGKGADNGEGKIINEDVRSLAFASTFGAPVSHGPRCATFLYRTSTRRPLSTFSSQLPSARASPRFRPACGW
jgi:hypothetical protein